MLAGRSPCTEMARTAQSVRLRDNESHAMGSFIILRSASNCFCAGGGGAQIQMILHES